MSNPQKDSHARINPVAPMSVSEFPESPIAGSVMGAHPPRQEPIAPKPPVSTKSGSTLTFGPNPPGEHPVAPKAPVGNNPAPPVTMGPNPPGQIPIKKPPVGIQPVKPIIAPIHGAPVTPVKPIAPPIAFPPAAGLQHGTVAASDGSTITWSTASDGTITASGGDQKLVLTRTVGATGRTQKAMYTENGQASPYFTLSSALSASGTHFEIDYSAGATSLSVTFDDVSSTSTGATATLVRPKQKPLRWSGTVDLTTPPAKLAAMAGWPSDTFVSQFKIASYFNPAVKQFPAAAPPAKATVAHSIAMAATPPSNTTAFDRTFLTVTGSTLFSGVLAVGFLCLSVEGLPLVALTMAGTAGWELFQDQVLNKDLNDAPPPADPAQGLSNIDPGTGQTGSDAPPEQDPSTGQGSQTAPTPPTQNPPDTGQDSSGTNPPPMNGTTDPDLPIAGVTNSDPSDPGSVSTVANDPTTGTSTISEPIDTNPIGSDPASGSSDTDSSTAGSASASDSNSNSSNTVSGSSESSSGDAGGGASGGGGGGGGDLGGDSSTMKDEARGLPRRRRVVDHA